MYLVGFVKNILPKTFGQTHGNGKWRNKNLYNPRTKRALYLSWHRVRGKKQKAGLDRPNIKRRRRDNSEKHPEGSF